MNTAEKLFSGLDKAIEKATKIGYKQGAKDVLNEFSEHAGRSLKNGDGSVMKTYNDIRRYIDKL